MEVLALDAGGDSNRTYLLLPGGGPAWCVDPSFGEEAVRGACEERGATLAAILLTHAHGDHTASVEPLRRRFGCEVLCHGLEASRVPGARALKGEGPIPGLPAVEALFTPGHTPGSTCYLAGEHLFTGDTLFVDWVGRADFAGGSPEALFESLGRLRSLPGHLLLHPGHDYGSVPSRTLAEEVAKNRFLACKDFQAFLRLLPELVE